MNHVLIADDHEVTRRGVRDILCGAFDAVAVDEASDATTLFASLPRHRWDLIVLDVMMPGSNVLDVLARVRAHDAKVPILVLTGATEVEYVVQTIKAGANGLIHKH